MLLYYITARTQFPGREAERRAALLARIAEAAHAGVDYIQLREKDLNSGDLASLARAALARIRANSSTTRLIINSRTDVALAVRADGAHLTSNDLAPAEVRAIVAATPRAAGFMIAVSCHSAAEVLRAAEQGADFAVLAPVFEKPGAAPCGLDALRAAAKGCAIPVLALGGVTIDNASACLAAGAAGVAGIRLFQQGDIADTVRRLRSNAITGTNNFE